jgi:type IV pilus assembly protein PilC
MYRYIAKNKAGAVVKGELNVQSREQAMTIINSMGVYLVSLEDGKKQLFKLPGKAGKKQIAIMLRQFSTMVNASIPIPIILSVLKEDEKNPALREMLTHLHKDVTDGTPLSVSMSAYPKHFSPFVINMIEMGETNGRLDIAFDRIATATEKDMKVAGKAKSAMIYPIILLTLAIGMTIFLSVKVVPTFAQLFIDFGGELPGITKMMLTISDFLQGYWYVVIIAIVGVVALIKTLWRKRNCRRYMERMLRKIPIYRGISDSKIMGKYSRVVSSMLDSGVSVIKTLTITKGSLQNVDFEDSFTKVISDVKTGVPIHQAIDSTGIFTSLVVSMTKIGEESGKIGELLNNTAEFYEEETERKIAAAMSFMEPLITIVLGVLIAFIVASIILPMFDMYSIIG